MTKKKQEREQAIKAYLNGETVTSIVQRLGRSRPWFYHWFRRYETRSEGEEWQEELSRRPHGHARKVSDEVVMAVKLVRHQLQEKGIFSGAQMIYWELSDAQFTPLPSPRTISRILEREELVKRRTGRYEPKGKPYPALRSRVANEVHQSDFVGPSYLTGPVQFYSLNSVDLATSRCAVTPQLDKTAQSTINGFWANWCRLGIPKHQQVDNEMVFYGSPTHPRGMGCLIRLCLAEGVEPWFIPLSEPWRNGVVEKFNDHYEKGLLKRVQISGADMLRTESLGFEQTHNSRHRYSKLGGRTPQTAFSEQRIKIRFPRTEDAPKHPLPKPESGRYHLVRHIRSDGVLNIFSEKFRAPPEAAYAYVIATIDVAQQKLRVRLGDVVIDEHDYRLR